MRSRTLAVVCAATALGLLLRLVDLTGPSLWHDEAYSMWVVQDPARFWARLATDGHPPLWYGFLAIWTALFGDSDLAGRLSSAVAVVPLVPLTAAAAARIFGVATARWSAVLVAVWPMVVSENRDVRMYAWLPVLTVLSLYLLERARTGDRRRDWIFAGISLAALAATHHFGTVIAGALVLAYGIRPAARRGLVVACAVAAILYAPVAIFLVFLVEKWPAGVSRGIGPGSLLQLATGLTVGPQDALAPALLLGAAAIVLCAAGIGAFRGRFAAPIVVPLVLGIALPVALAAWVFAFPPAPRYFTIVVPLMAILVAHFFATARENGARIFAALVAVVLVAGSVSDVITNPGLTADWRGLASLVARETRVEDAVFVAPSYFTLAYTRYTDGRLPVRSVPEVAAAPPDFPNPTDDELQISLDADGPHWLLIADWLMAQRPEIADELSRRGTPVATGWWMRAFRLPGGPALSSSSGTGRSSSRPPGSGRRAQEL